ncbi:AraC family transcriptional regulator [Paenibacillus sp. HB172176]|uniref:AraC family transcriptional regulator n=1 Tax=Paenibacillus sp. HB172176 TaxID=2493690 RepID=UPI00143983EF|nr:AraC family transcriptional regulator [Paenibacillus sp. HB172176]
MSTVNKSTYFRKILLLIIVVGVIPVLLLGSYAYMTSAKIAKRSVMEGNAQILLQSKQKIEQLLQTVDYLATQFITTPATLEAVDHYDLLREKDEVTREFYRSLARLQMIGTGIRDVALVSFNEGWAIDNDGLSDLSLERNRQYAELARTDKPSYWTGDADTQSIYFVKKIPVYALQPTGLIVFSIPPSAIGQQLVHNPSTGTIRILNTNLEALASTDNTPYMQRQDNAAHLLDKAARSDMTSGNGTVRQGGKDYLLAYERSSYSQWIYISEIAKEQVTKGARQIGWTTLIICLALLCVTILLTFTGSRFVYRPVRSLYDYVVRLGGHSLPESGADELQRIRHVFESMLDKQAKLDTKLLGHTSQLDELFTMKLLMGKMPQREILEKLQANEQGGDWKEKCVIVVKIDTLSNTRYESKDQELLLFAINNIVEELIPKERRIKPVSMELHQAALIGSLGEKTSEFEAYIDMIVNKAQSTIKKVLQLNVSVGISRLFTNWTHASKTYSEAIEALKYRIIMEDECIVRIEDVEPDRHKSYEYPELLENELIGVIKTGNLLLAEEHLSLFMQEVVRQKLDHRVYQMLLMRLLIRILQVKDSVQGAASLPGTIFADFLTLRNVGEIESWLMQELIEPLIAAVKQAAEAQHRTISRQVKDLVQARYDQPLTLEDCASTLNYNSSYISKVFRKETGINFLDYLQTYRLNMAKIWLTDTDMLIAEIAEKLQYNNSQNFIRYFRKMEGMTPGQFREQQR